MKKLSLIVPLLFIGCGTINTNFINQPSYSTQKMDAKNAWDELDGKEVSTPTPTKQIKSPNIEKVAKSMLETSDTIPNWFYSPPKSDKYFYGAGEGRDVEEAKVSALNFIAGEINTAVSSSFTKTEGYSKGSNGSDFYKSVRSKTRSEVRKINFTNIEIMKTLKVNNKIYLLVRIDKQKLFNSLKTKFDIIDSKIDNEIKTSKQYSKLDQLITLNKIKPQIQKAISLATILNTLNPNFDVVKYTNKYNSYMNQKTKLLHEITFSIKGDDLFAQKLIELLNEEGYKISNSSDIEIKLTKQVRLSKPYGMSVARVTVNIQVMANNKTLNSASIETKGISDTPSQAIAKASINFKQKVEKIGINKLLGFE